VQAHNRGRGLVFPQIAILPSWLSSGRRWRRPRFFTNAYLVFASLKKFWLIRNPIASANEQNLDRLEAVLQKIN
jgi:hypothetical protein